MGFEDLDKLLEIELGGQGAALREDTRPGVMIIDDNREVCEALTLVLKNRYRVSSFFDATSGLAALDERTHAVLLDIKMEGIDGFQCLAMIKERYTHLPVIFHSAYQDLRDPYEVMNTLKPFGYLQKGCSEAELLKVLERAVQYRRKFADSERRLRELAERNEELHRRIEERESQLRERRAPVTAVGGPARSEVKAPRSVAPEESPVKSRVEGAAPVTMAPRSVIVRDGDQLERLYGLGSVVMRLSAELDICRNGRRSLLCCLFEVVGFENIRARDGLLKSDEIVERVSQRIQQETHGQRLIGRLGESRIVVILPGMGATSSESMVRDVLRRVSRPNPADTALPGGGLSCGAVCSASGAGGDGRKLLSLVERALDTAKSKGAGAYHFEAITVESRETKR